VQKPDSRIEFAQVRIFIVPQHSDTSLSCP